MHVGVIMGREFSLNVGSSCGSHPKCSRSRRRKMGSSTGAAADIWSRKPLNDAPKSVGEMGMEMVPSGVDSPGARPRARRAGPVRHDSFTIPLEVDAEQCGRGDRSRVENFILDRHLAALLSWIGSFPFPHRSPSRHLDAGGKEAAMPTPSALTVGCTRRGYCVRVAGPARCARARPCAPSQSRSSTSGAARPSTSTSPPVSTSTAPSSAASSTSSAGSSGQARPALAIAGPTEVLHHLLGPTRLDAILPLRADRPERLGEEVLIPPQVLDSHDLGRHVLECHRRLAELGGANAAVFGPIADQLARDLDRNAGSRPA